MSYLPCNLKLYQIFMTILTLATNSLNKGGFSKVNMCGLMPTNSNCSLIDTSKYKRMTQSIYIFTIIKVSINHYITIENLNKLKN
jgi:hypothetical protein